MVVVFLATAVLYLLLQAPVIAFLQMLVYAGGIMVLFLFVVMLIGAERVSHLEPLRWQRPLAFGLASILLLESVYLAFQKAFGSEPANVRPDFGNPRDVGLLLFTKYPLPFEVISILLVIAVIAAVVLSIGKGIK